MHLIASQWKFDKFPFLFWFHLLTVKPIAADCQSFPGALTPKVPRDALTSFFFFNWCLLFTRTGASSKRRDCTLSEKSVEQKVISLFKLSHKVHTNYTGRSYALSYWIGRNYYVTWHVTLLTYFHFWCIFFSVKLIGMNIVRTYPVPYMMCWKHRSGSQKQFLLIIYR